MHQPSDTLILLGKGPSRRAIFDLRAQFPTADLWTLNNIFPNGSDPEMNGLEVERLSSLHFDVHHDMRFWDHFARFRAGICSPFREAPSAHVRPFPLESIFAEFGVAYFENSFDYMVALACYHHKRGTKRLARLAIPGCCMMDPTHFAYRFGLHFWLGVARGLGIELIIPEPSLVLQRKTDAKVVSTDDEFPHLYGQPWSVSEPHAKRYGWRQ